jgi:uncharacterized membrane protein YfhO
MSSNIKRQQTLDKFAVILSGVCVLHCLLAPIALTALPLIAANALLEEVLFHKAILWLVIPSSSIALFIGCRKHRDWLIAGSGILGMLLLILIAFFAHDIMSPVQEKIATSVAGIILAISHILNYKACQNQPCDDKDCSSKHHH